MNSLKRWITTTGTTADDDFIKQIEELQKALEDSYGPLSEEELRELNNLEDVHNAEVKSFKISRFKSLPAAVRQTIVDSIIFHKNVAETVKNTPKPPDRLSELRHKKLDMLVLYLVDHQVRL
jgi:hypothetical protein